MGISLILIIVVVSFGLLFSLGGLVAAAVLLLNEKQDRGVAIAVLSISGLCFLATLAAIAGMAVYLFF